MQSWLRFWKKRTCTAWFTTLELVGDRQTIIFAGTVRSRLICDIINRHKPGAAWVSGRRRPTTRIAAKFADGDSVCGECASASRGFDAPPVAAVCMMTATKVRAKYTQCVGGDGPTVSLPYDSSAMTRRDHSGIGSKPDLMVLDFEGNAGKLGLSQPLMCWLVRTLGFACVQQRWQPKVSCLTPLKKWRRLASRGGSQRICRGSRAGEVEAGQVELASTYLCSISRLRTWGSLGAAHPEGGHSDKQMTFANQGLT